MKIPQFIAKLSSKQIYGIPGISTILFVIIGFVVAQNIQNYTANSQVSLQNISNSTTNSNPNSVNSSSSYNSILSSGNPNSILTNSEVVSSSQNSNSTINSKQNIANSQNNSTNFQASSQTNSQSFRDFLNSDKTRLQNLSQTLTKIDTSQKPFLLLENQLLDQKNKNYSQKLFQKVIIQIPNQFMQKPKKLFTFHILQAS